MSKQYLYLLLDLGSLSVPLLSSFYPKANFSREWKYYLPGIAITAVIFIVWDEIFTEMGVWGFNPEYLTGIYIGSLPLEELLFFICIPYACLFTYFALRHLWNCKFSERLSKTASLTLMTISILLGAIHLDKWYTTTTFIGLALFIAYDLFIAKSKERACFYAIYVVLLIPFFIVNGVLTGSWIDKPVVWYNDAENLGIRLGTIPVEDVFYGMLMILLSLKIAELLRSRKTSLR